MYLRGICWFAGLIAALLCHTGAARAESPESAAQLWLNMLAISDGELLAAASDTPFERHVIVDGKPGKKCKKKTKAARKKALTGVLACAIAEDAALFEQLAIAPGEYVRVDAETLPPSLAKHKGKLAKAAKKKGTTLVMVERRHEGTTIEVVFVVQEKKDGTLRVTGVYEAKTAAPAQPANDLRVVGLWRETWGDPENTDVTYHDQYVVALDRDGNPDVRVQGKNYAIDQASLSGNTVRFTQHTSFEVRYELTLSADGLLMTGTATTPDGVYPIKWERLE